MPQTVCIGIIVFLIISSFTILPVPIPSRDAKVSAPAQLTVLDVPFNSEVQVNKYIGYYYHFPTDMIKNLSYSYDSNENAAKLSVTYPYTGHFALGGFTPALETNISLEVKMIDYGFNNGAFSLESYQIYLALANYPSTSKYKFFVYYYNDTGLQAMYQNGPVGYYNKYVKIEISWYANRTYHYAFCAENGTVFWQGWIKTRQDYNYTEQQSMFAPFIMMDFYPGSGMTNGATYSMYLKNLTQTIPLQSSNNVFGYIPQHTYAALGFDHIYKGTYKNVTPALRQYGYHATYFWDTNNENTSNGWNDSIMKDAIEHGDEFGIHLSNKFDSYNASNIVEINKEVRILISKAESLGWKNSSFVWTSLGNQYAWQYNDYMWEQWNAVGRKIWGHSFGYQGYLSNHDVGLNVQFAAERGWSWIAYTHCVGSIWVDGQYHSDITPAQFDSFLANNSKNNIHVVGYFEYWSRYAAPWWVSGTVIKITEQDYKVTVRYDKFIVPNGFRVAVKIIGLNASNLVIHDNTLDTNITDYNIYDWGIVFEAHDGHTYEIYEENNIPEFSLTFVPLIFTIILATFIRRLKID